MLVMSQINHIRDLKQSGYRISEIVKITGTDPKTIRKYLEMEDFSPDLPPCIKQRPSKLDPFKPWINEWLEEDRKHWYKQHHTARRIYVNGIIKIPTFGGENSPLCYAGFKPFVILKA